MVNNDMTIDSKLIMRLQMLRFLFLICNSNNLHENIRKSKFLELCFIIHKKKKSLNYENHSNLSLIKGDLV